MDNALSNIGIFLEKIFGPEGAALLLDDLKIALTVVDAECADTKCRKKTGIDATELEKVIP